MKLRHIFAILPRVPREFCFEFLPLRYQRAQGMPGARCARSRACRVENTRVSHHGHTGSPGIPRAMVLTVSFVLSPVIGLLTPSQAELPPPT
jgi:hypothetical protein